VEGETKDTGTARPVRPLVTETVHVLLALLVPLYGGLALGLDDAAFVAVVTCLILHMIDAGAGRRGSPLIVLGAGAVLFAAALGGNMLAGQSLLLSAYVLSIVFVGGLGSFYGRFWGTVGIAVPIALVVIAYAIGESATVQDAAIGLAAGIAWSIVLTVVFRFVRPRPDAAAGQAESPTPLTEEARRALIMFSARRTVAVALAMLIGVLGANQRPYWVMLTVLVVLQPAAEKSVERALQYGVGTAVGVLASALAIVVFGVTGLPSAIILTLLVAAIVVASQIDYGLQTAFTTALVLSVVAIVYPDEASLFGERLLDAMAGIGIAMVVEYARLMPVARRTLKE
jgi:uncharacterized membrane protein YccC